MSTIDIAAMLQDATLLALKLSTPLLVASLLAGVLLAVVQAVTQISDSSLSFLPKLIATAAAAWYAGPYMARTMGDYMHMSFDMLVRMGGN